MEQIVTQGCGCGHQADKPTQILSDEHRVIERVLTALEGLIKRPVGGSLDDWKKAVDFFRTFADQCHHFKEEKVLFPAMEEHGIPSDGGPIGMMLTEHEEGRSYVRGMAAAITLVESKNEAAIGPPKVSQATEKQIIVAKKIKDKLTLGLTA
jgi:hemerythrin-like domain-containing protein